MRRFLRRHDGIAMLLVVAALALKLLVPSGFMPVTARDGTITVRICSGVDMTPQTMVITIPGLPAQTGDHPAPAKAEMPCAFAGLAMPMVGGVDALVLAVAVAFAMALAVRRVASAPFASPARLRPPLRAPPIPA